MNGRSPLRFPEADAKALGELLEKSSYKVEYLLGKNATKPAIGKKLAELRKQADSDGICLVGMFGHGVEIQKTERDGSVSVVGCFCPFDTEVRQAVDEDGKLMFVETAPMIEADPDSLITMEQVLNALKIAKAGNRVVIADCCRELPNRARGRNLGLGASFKAADLPSGTVVLFGCKPGEKALERDDWLHGAFTKCLLEDINRLGKIGSVTTGALADSVKQNVQRLTGRQQTPMPFAVDSIDLMLSIPPSEVPPKPLPPVALPGSEEFRIGLSHLRGENGPVDEILGLRFCQMASEKGHPLATAWVACSHFHGWGGNEEDIATAFRLLKPVVPQITNMAAKADPEAQLLLGIAHRNAIGMPRNWYKAAQYLGESYRLGNTDAAAYLGELYQDADPEKAFLFASDGARKGNVTASLLLAGLINKGVGTKKDYDRSVELLKELQPRAIPQARHDYAHHFEEYNKEYNGGKVDNEQALKLKEEAYNLGLRGTTFSCFARSYFESPDAANGRAKGLALLAKSAATSIYCQDDLIYRISNGDGVEKDEAKALDWRRHRYQTCLSTAQAGHVDSLLRMSHLLSNGDGVDADTKEALKWLIKSQHTSMELTNGLKDLVDVGQKSPDEQKVYAPVAALLSPEEALQACDELAIECPGPILSSIRCEIALLKNPEDVRQATLLVKTLRELALSPYMTNDSVWAIYTDCADAVKKNPTLCRALIDLQKKAIEDETIFVTRGRAQYLDTLAHLHEANNDLALAIAAQREAVRLAGDDDLKKQYLDSLLTK